MRAVNDRRSGAPIRFSRPFRESIALCSLINIDYTHGRAIVIVISGKLCRYRLHRSHPQFNDRLIADKLRIHIALPPTRSKQLVTVREIPIGSRAKVLLRYVFVTRGHAFDSTFTFASAIERTSENQYFNRETPVYWQGAVFLQRGKMKRSPLTPRFPDNSYCPGGCECVLFAVRSQCECFVSISLS